MYVMHYSVDTNYIRGPFYQHELALIPTSICSYIHYKVWDEIIHSFVNFNGVTVEVWEWISDFIHMLLGM